MNLRPFVWAATAAGISILLGGASQGKTPASGVPRAPGNPVSEVSSAECPAVPDGVPMIDGLQTAWAIPQPSSSSIRLLFSDQALGCGDPDWHGPPPPIERDCINSWQFALTLPPELQKPGVYDLASYAVDYADKVTTVTPGSGCNGAGCTGTGSGSAGGAKGPDATIEIYSVSDACISGRILRLSTGSSNAEPDFTGAFSAVICTPSP
ncbi:MAG TPA: hypothetical protein VK540_10535 [Polyangiaceae bacterium]|nr:hypothetical protein [Polyangiaceae bacterium]